MAASAKGQVECVKILLSAGADVFLGDGRAALDWAIQNNNTAVIVLLRAHIKARAYVEGML